MFLSPQRWLFFAIFLAPLRAYGWTGFPLGTLSGFRVAFIVCISLWFLNVIIEKKVKLAPGSKLGFILSIINAVLVMVAIAYSPDLGIGDAVTMVSVKLAGWIIIAVFCLVITSRLDIEVAIKVYVYSSIIPMVVGWYQWIYFQLHNSLAPMPLEDLSVKGEKMLGVIDSIYFRPSSTLLEPNFYAFFLASVSIILLANILAKHRIIGAQLSIVLFVSAVLQQLLTLSLSAFLGWFVGVVIVLVIHIRSVQKVILYAGILGLFVVLAFTVLPKDNVMYEGIVNKIEQRSNDVGSGFGRAEFVKNAIDAVEDSAGFGVGFGGLGHHYSSQISSAHVALLTVLAEQGIIPFLLIVFWLLWVIMGLINALRQKDSRALAAGIIGSGAAVMIANFAYDAMFSYDAMWTFFGIATVASAILRSSYYAQWQKLN